MTLHNLTNIALQTLLLLFLTTIPTVSGGLYAQTADANETSFKKCWEYKTEGLSRNPLASDNVKIFMATETGSVQAIDSVTAGNLWTTELGGLIVSNILVTEEFVLVVTNPSAGDGTAVGESLLRSLSKETGITIWSVRLPFSKRTFLGNTQNSIIAVGHEGSMVALQKNEGGPLWKTQFAGTVTAPPFFSEHGIVVGSSEKQLLLISNENGKELFKSKTANPPTAVTISPDKTLIAGDERGNVALIDPSDGKQIWKFKSGAGVSYVANSKNGLIVTSLDNFIYLISMYNGDVIWKRRMPGRVVDGVLSTEEFIFTLVYAENFAFLIDSKTGKIKDQLALKEKNYISQIPISAGDSKIVFATSDGVESHSSKPCPVKQEKRLRGRFSQNIISIFDANVIQNSRAL